MTKFRTIASAFAIALACSSAAWAGDTDPLFINLTSDEAHRVTMALGFGGMQMERGHPLTVFLNDRGVIAASKTNSERFASQQAMLSRLVEAGATVLVCAMCMKQYGVNQADLLPGLDMGSPERSGGQLFLDDTVTLSW